MRERVRQLREAREEERKRFVEEKKEQHFIVNCTELRELKSKQDTDVCCCCNPTWCSDDMFSSCGWSVSSR